MSPRSPNGTTLPAPCWGAQPPGCPEPQGSASVSLHTPNFFVLLNFLLSVFSLKGDEDPDIIPLLLTQSGDIETNPGPTTVTYICPICTKTITNKHYSLLCNRCSHWTHLKCTTLKTYRDYTPQWTCGCPTPPHINSNPSTPQANHNRLSSPPPSSQQHPNPTPTPSHSNTSQQQPKHTLNILQININGIRTKKTELHHFLIEQEIHIALIQETRLIPSAHTPTFTNYTTLRQDRTHGQGGGLITLIHHTIPFTDTTQHTKQHIQNNTTEIQSIKIQLHKVPYNIINTYIPPSASCPHDFSLQLDPINNIPNLFLCGDFNAHHPTWLTTQTLDQRGDTLLTQLHTLNILNLRNKPTRLPHNLQQQPTSPDITFCSPTLHTRTTWETKHMLSSDHLPIIISFQLAQPTKTSYKTTYTNYKRANWPAFTQHIESALQEFSTNNFQNIDQTISHFNNAISQANKKYIPQGYRKQFNPNYSPQIPHLIAQRNALRQNTSPTQQTLDEISTLNNTINRLTTEQQTLNWKNYLDTLNHKTSSSQLWKTVKKIHTSHTTPAPTHEALLTPQNRIATPKEHANILIKHYANISHKPTTPQNRKITKTMRKTHIDPTADPPYTHNDTTKIIKTLKNSSATGPDNISNIHIKHLGPRAIQALTSIFNLSWLHNTIPNIWKQAKIIPILKQGKPPNLPISYRPISLLSTISKVLERLILNRIQTDIPLSHSQHGFRANHSTTTLHSNLVQHILNGFNLPQPPARTLMAAIDISKAFDTVPRHILTQKILNTTIHNNDKRWLSNFLAGRQARVSYHNTLSRTRNLPNGVPQGAVLSPTLFNLFLHDLPLPQPGHNTEILSYADDLTITSQHPKITQAKFNIQQYLHSLEHWLTKNRMTVSPSKSSITLLTPDRHESNMHPHVTLYNQPLPLNKTPNILGLTYDTHMTFSPHTTTINSKATRKLNAIRTLTGTSFGQQKESLTILYKQFARSTINYASPAWTPTLSKTNLKKLQTTQNKALRTITGCLNTTNTHHLHNETKILPLETHFNMLGTQFYAKAHDPSHPSHPLTNHPPRPRHKKHTPSSHYSQLHSEIPPTPPNTTLNNHIHTHFTQHALNDRPPNTILNTPPPNIDPSETTLTRATRVTLSRLRCGHHPSLQEYRYRIGLSGDPNCPRCHTSPDDTRHLLTDCPTLTQLRQQYNITSVQDLWSRPCEVADYLGAAGFP